MYEEMIAAEEILIKARDAQRESAIACADRFVEATRLVLGYPAARTDIGVLFSRTRPEFGSVKMSSASRAMSTFGPSIYTFPFFVVVIGETILIHHELRVVRKEAKSPDPSVFWRIEVGELGWDLPSSSKLVGDCMRPARELLTHWRDQQKAENRFFVRCP